MGHKESDTASEWESEDSGETERDQDEGEEDELTRRICTMLPHAPPGRDHRDPREQRVRDVVRRSLKQGSPAYGRQEAIDEGGTFRIEEERVRADEQYIRESGGLTAAATNKHNEKMGRNERMTREKVRATISWANPEREKLLNMCAEANGGVKVLRPPEFEPNGRHPENMPRPSKASQEAAGALHKIFDKTYIQPDL